MTKFLGHNVKSNIIDNSDIFIASVIYELSTQVTIFWIQSPFFQELALTSHKMQLKTKKIRRKFVENSEFENIRFVNICLHKDKIRAEFVVTV